MPNFQILADANSESGSGSGDVGLIMSSAPVSKRSSPRLPRTRTAGGDVGRGDAAVENDKKVYEMLSHLRNTLAEKDKEIVAMRDYVKEMKVQQQQ
jgi:hypothetical protein